MAKKEVGILAQKPLRRRRGRGGALLPTLAVIPLFGVVAAFGFAPENTPEIVDIRHVVEDIALPFPSAPEQTVTQNFWREERIRRGDTVATIMLRLGVEDREAMTYLLQARGVRSLYQLMPGRAVRAITTTDGRLIELSYFNANGKRLLVNRTADGFRATENTPELDTRIVQSSASITYSLFGATDAAGLHENVAIQLADIFSSDIDFNRDIRKGDRFLVVYQSNYSDGEFLGVGRVIAAEFINQGTIHRAVYFEDDKGRG